VEAENDAGNIEQPGGAGSGEALYGLMPVLLALN
jgi:hypothetical protein